MTRKTIEELNALDAAKIEKRRRMLARSRDKVIGDIEALASECDRVALLMAQDGLGSGPLTDAGTYLRQYADKRIDAAAPKQGGA